MKAFNSIIVLLAATTPCVSGDDVLQRGARASSSYLGDLFESTGRILGSSSNGGGGGGSSTVSAAHCERFQNHFGTFEHTFY
jgi:hypothetical protein